MRFYMSVSLVYNVSATWLKNLGPLYLTLNFNVTTVNPLETGGLSKILNIFATTKGALQMIP